MDHNQALALMAPERYLLDELEPEQRDAFEEHLFDCHECALDTRAAAAFLDHTKVLLPQMQENQSAPAPQVAQQPKPRFAQGFSPENKPSGLASRLKSSLAALLRPAILTPILVPAFAIMLAVLGYQNFVTLPALTAANDAPRLTPWIVLHNATRGSHQIVPLDPRQGASLVVQLQPEIPCSTYTFTLYDAQGKAVWTRNAVAVAAAANPESSYALSLPAQVFHSGTYRLAITGVTTTGTTVPVQESTFDLQPRQ